MTGRARGAGGPSERAVEAVVRRAVMLSTHLADPESEPMAPEEWAPAILDAAHDPALGLDRSVCLRDVARVHGAAVVTPGEPMPDASAFVTWEATLKDAQAAIDRAYDHRRRVLIAAHEAGLTYGTIANTVGLSTAGVHKIARSSKPSQDELLKSRVES